MGRDARVEDSPRVVVGRWVRMLGWRVWPAGGLWGRYRRGVVQRPVYYVWATYVLVVGRVVAAAKMEPYLRTAADQGGAASLATDQTTACTRHLVGTWRHDVLVRPRVEEEEARS